MDTFLWILASVAQVVIGIVGFALTLRPALAGPHFKLLLTTFVSATAIAVGASLWSFVRSQKSSAAVTLLTESILNEVKGSPDSVLHIGPNFTKSQGGDYEKGICTFQYYNDSDYPMIDTQVGIVGVRYIDFPEWGRRLGDVRPKRGGELTGLRVTLPKEENKISEIQFSIDCRSVTLWQTIYFQWNGKAWISDATIFREVDGKQVYVRDLRPNSPFASIVEQDKKNALEKWEAEKAAEKEEMARNKN